MNTWERLLRMSFYSAVGGILGFWFFFSLTIASRARGPWFLPSIDNTGMEEEKSAEIQFVRRSYFSSGLLHGWLGKVTELLLEPVKRVISGTLTNWFIIFCDPVCEAYPPAAACSWWNTPKASSLGTKQVSAVLSLFEWASLPWGIELVPESWIYASAISLCFPKVILKNGLPFAHSFAWDGRGTCVLQNCLIYDETRFRRLAPGSK